MQIGEAGESRVRGYLFVLERSLRSFLPAETARDAVEEVRSHIRERIGQAEPVPDERSALEAILAELGPPLTVAKAYAVEVTVEQAVVTGRMLAVLRALGHFAKSAVGHFFASIALFAGYTIGGAFMVIALLKPLFPANVGFFFMDGRFRGLGATFPVPPGAEVRGGYWLIPVALMLGSAVLIATHSLSRWLLARWRERRKARSWA